MFSAIKQFIQLLSLIGYMSFVGLSHAQFKLQDELSQAANQEKALLEIELPKPFQVAKLVPYSPFAYSALKFFIDPDSISFIKQAEVRLVAVTLNESGGYQAVYLGFNCDTSEYKQYGFLDTNTWRVPAEVIWRPIPRIGYNQYVSFLAKASICEGNGPVLVKSKILEGLAGPRMSLF